MNGIIWKDFEMNKNEENTTHCCTYMAKDIENSFCPIRYVKKYREYLVELRESTGGITMKYCYNCGAKLPESLRDMWGDILEQEYGLKYPLGMDKNKVPKEFLTNEWWKKRGL
jgi:hypothetical protein